MKRKSYYFLLACFSMSMITRSQNLVNNGGFESYSALPNTYNQLNRCTGWSNCNGHYGPYVSGGTWGSPDYKHTLGTNEANLPGTYVASTNPHGGNAAAGFVTYNAYCADCREYIRTYLTSPMTVGTTYSVTFYATTGQNSAAKYVTNNIGILFSKDSTWQPGSGDMRLNRVPHYNMNSVLSNTAWAAFSFTFTADSAYKYITIGNYKTDANTTMTQGNGTQWYAYNFVDDFSVMAVVNTGLEEMSLNERNVLVYPNPSAGEVSLKGSQAETITVINDFGQILFDVELNANNNYESVLNSLKPGVYFAHGKYTRTKFLITGNN